VIASGNILDGFMAERTRPATYLLRMTEEEKQAFQDAAELAGLDLAAWVRTVLRKAAAKELSDAGQAVAFQKARKTSRREPR
jgi:uncharacterized protein (DUF1778 family)